MENGEDFATHYAEALQRDLHVVGQDGDFAGQLWNLEGKKAEAAAAVPAEMIELSHLVGPASYVKERIGAFKEAGVTVLSVNPVGGDPVQTIATLRSLVDDV